MNLEYTFNHMMVSQKYLFFHTIYLIDAVLGGVNMVELLAMELVMVLVNIATMLEMDDTYSCAADDVAKDIDIDNQTYMNNNTCIPPTLVLESIPHPY